MFNVRQLYSIPQCLRENFLEVSYNEQSFTTIKIKKRDAQFCNHASSKILAEKYKHL